MPRCTTTTVVPREGDLLVPGSLGAHALAWLGQLAGAERIARRARRLESEAVMIASAATITLGRVFPGSISAAAATAKLARAAEAWHAYLTATESTLLDKAALRL